MLRALLSKTIGRLYVDSRDKMRKKWNRDLPFEELLFDRWERAKNLDFGASTSIYHNSYVYGDVKVGDHSWIGPFTLLDGTGGLVIGEWCCISSGVHIYTHDTVKRFLSKDKEPTAYASVEIKNNCFVGPQSVIKSGVTIGEYSVVGACSFVNKDVPPFAIVAGNPAKIIGKIDFDPDGKTVFVYE